MQKPNYNSSISKLNNCSNQHATRAININTSQLTTRNIHCFTVEICISLPIRSRFPAFLLPELILIAADSFS